MKWLAETCKETIPPKNKIAHTTIKKKVGQLELLDLTFKRLLAIQSVVNHLTRHGASQKPWRSPSRKLRETGEQAAKLIGQPLTIIQQEVPRLAHDHMNNTHKETMKQWKERARQWKISSSKAFAFVKNPSPAKSVVLKIHQRRKKKAYTTTTQRNYFRELFWPQRKTFQAGGGYKNPIQTRKNHIYHRNLSSVAPIFFRQGKVLHWSRAVYAFFFPVHEGIISSPTKIEEALLSYWAGVECWPENASLDHVLSNLEQHYSFLLPFHLRGPVSYRAIRVAIVSRNSFVLVFVGYRTIIARYVA